MILDVFNTDAFSAISLTQGVNLRDSLPSHIRDMNLFTERGVPTTTVMIEEKNDQLGLIASSPRGSDPASWNASRRTARNLSTIHIAQRSRIFADEMIGVRQFGSESALQTVQGKINDHEDMLLANKNMTLENLLLGALQGIVYDSDGSTVLYNLFTEFNVTQETKVGLDLDNAANGALREELTQTIRTMMRNLKGARPTGFHCLCSDTFFDRLIKNAEVRASYLQQQEANQLRNSGLTPFSFAGITFENYMGSDDTTSVAIATTEAIMFPVGVPGLFEVYYGPADILEAVGTEGLPVYSRVIRDTQGDRWVDVEIQTNPLPICTQPLVLQQLDADA